MCRRPLVAISIRCWIMHIPNPWNIALCVVSNRRHYAWQWKCNLLVTDTRQCCCYKAQRRCVGCGCGSCIASGAACRCCRCSRTTRYCCRLAAHQRWHKQHTNLKTSNHQARVVLDKRAPSRLKPLPQRLVTRGPTDDTTTINPKHLPWTGWPTLSTPMITLFLNSEHMSYGERDAHTHSLPHQLIMQQQRELCMNRATYLDVRWNDTPSWLHAFILVVQWLDDRLVVGGLQTQRTSCNVTIDTGLYHGHCWPNQFDVGQLC
jgi:hypothetical protein